ncbi:hypothetical protein ACFSMW_00775 [Virgibacillus halophilus]|uniref:Uncharacterized protein n=1 Tax=Tigheibacillus halophilus TaxID=361280 RepID=A0ABU5CAI4_9BACI|nr:hypothetical protein [Virgibacillus halophilus]
MKGKLLILIIVVVILIAVAFSYWLLQTMIKDEHQLHSSGQVSYNTLTVADDTFAAANLY